MYYNPLYVDLLTSCFIKFYDCNLTLDELGMPLLITAIDHYMH